MTTEPKDAIREREIARLIAVSPQMRDEPAAFKAACIRMGWDAARESAACAEEAEVPPDVAGLVERLRGEPEFGIRQFESPPICHEAADALTALAAERDALRERAEKAEAENKRLLEFRARRVFDNADWYWSTLDSDECGDTPEEAISKSMLGDFVIFEIASSFSGPTRFGFMAPTLTPEDDETEFLHFETADEARLALQERLDAIDALSADNGDAS